MSLLSYCRQRQPEPRTFALGLGKLDFATGQDSYIDPASQVAKDNHAYQELFGGENMVVLFTVPESPNFAVTGFVVSVPSLSFASSDAAPTSE